MSLGIGDGANDVGMLIAANVGVGIRGKEGLQAVRAADFSIPEFKWADPLLNYVGSTVFFLCYCLISYALLFNLSALTVFASLPFFAFNAALLCCV